ncbi:unnamed protein product [Lepidochelys kempii]
MTVRCECRCRGARVLLYKAGDPEARQDKDPPEDVAQFSIHNVSQRDAGSYSCRYSIKSDLSVWSEPSDAMELVVAEGTDPAGPQQPDPPMMEPEGEEGDGQIHGDRRPQALVYAGSIPAEGTALIQPGAAPAPTRPSRAGPVAPLGCPDFTHADIACLALSAMVLLIVGLILAEAHYSRPRVVS